MLLAIYKNKYQNKLYSFLSSVYLIVVLMQVFYLLQAESKRLYKLFKYIKVSCYEIRIQCRDKLKRQQEK